MDDVGLEVEVAEEAGEVEEAEVEVAIEEGEQGEDAQGEDQRLLKEIRILSIFNRRMTN